MAYYNEAGEIFTTIMAIAQGASDVVSSVKRGKNTSGYLARSSIMKAAKDLTMSFPVVCSDTVTPTTATMIVKAIERNCVTTLQMLFVSANLKGMDGIDVLRKWHKNMDNSIDMNDYLDYLDAIDATFTESATEELKAVANKFGREMLDEIASSMTYFPAEDFHPKSVNRFTISEEYYGVRVSESYTPVQEAPQGPYNPLNDMIENPYATDPSMRGLLAELRKSGIDTSGVPTTRYFITDKELKAYSSYVNQLVSTYGTKAQQAQWDKINKHQEDLRMDALNRDQYQKDKDLADRIERQQNREEDRAYQAGRDAVKDRLDQDNLRLNRAKFDQQQRMDAIKMQTAQTQFFTQQLLSSDVKKCNEMVPSMIIVRFNATDDDVDYDGPNYQQFIAGVKARLIAVPSMDIIDAIRATERNRVNFVNLVRATTKEISFCRDFVAAIDQAKIDAKRNSKLSRTSPIWRSLQWRSSKSVMNRLRRHKPNDAGAITTLVVTSEEANYMKSQYNIDLRIPNKVKSIMEQYNLMCFCIVDEERETLSFLFDGEKYWQDYSFTALERETGDSSYKKVINLMSKINR